MAGHTAIRLTSAACFDVVWPHVNSSSMVYFNGCNYCKYHSLKTVLISVVVYRGRETMGKIGLSSADVVFWTVDFKNNSEKNIKTQYCSFLFYQLGTLDR